MLPAWIAISTMPVCFAELTSARAWSCRRRSPVRSPLCPKFALNWFSGPLAKVRGRRGAQAVSLAVIVYNLKRMMNVLGLLRLHTLMVRRRSFAYSLLLIWDRRCQNASLRKFCLDLEFLIGY